MMQLKKQALVGLLLLSVSGCAENPLMQTSQATSTAGVDHITADLDASLATLDKPKQAVPDPVSRALMPGLSVPVSVAEERFDVKVEGVDAKEFFDSLVEGTPYNLMLAPGVQGRISLNLNDVTVPEVINIVADLYGYQVSREGGIYRISPGGLQTKIFHINYLAIKRVGGSETQVSSGQVTNSNSSGSNSDTGSNSNSSSNSNGTNNSSLIGTRILTSTESDFWQQLGDTLSMIIGEGEGNKVITTPGAGMVVVRADAADLKSVEDYLTTAELIMQRQVVIEAKILEVTLREGYEQGISWTQLEEDGSDLAADGLAKKFLATAVDGNALTNEIGGVFGAALRVGDFEVLVQLLGTQGNVQVLSSPRISTVNNQKAVIKVGTDEFFVTDISFDQNNTDSVNNDTTTTDITLTPFFSGISLDVTPQINASGGVILHVHPSVSEVRDQRKVITLGEKDLILPLAESTVRETDSVIAAKNGQIVVIGGLIQTSVIEDNAAVPFFADIPVVGELFKQKRSRKKKSELVILLRPVLASDDVFDNDLRQSRERFGVLQQLMKSSDAPRPHTPNSPSEAAVGEQ